MNMQNALTVIGHNDPKDRRIKELEAQLGIMNTIRDRQNREKLGGLLESYRAEPDPWYTNILLAFYTGISAFRMSLSQNSARRDRRRREWRFGGV